MADKYVPAHSRATFKVNDLLGGAYEASLKLESTQPVVAERAIYFDYTGYGAPGWTGGHCVMGATTLEDGYDFAEGYTGPGFDTYITIQNPNPYEIYVDASFCSGPEMEDLASASYAVPANGRKTVYVNGIEGVGEDKEFSTSYLCSSPFLAERSMYFDYLGVGVPRHWTGGHCVIGKMWPAYEWYFAEGYTGPGFEEYLCIQNLGETAHITIAYYPVGGGEPIVRKHPDVLPYVRYTVNVNRDAGEGLTFSTRVVSDVPVLVERPMYFRLRDPGLDRRPLRGRLHPLMSRLGLNPHA